MSYDDRRFMLDGLRVRHSYIRRRGCYAKCKRCGVKRRATSSGWEYAIPCQRGQWTSRNPPCSPKDPNRVTP